MPCDSKKQVRQTSMRCWKHSAMAVSSSAGMSFTYANEVSFGSYFANLVEILAALVLAATDVMDGDAGSTLVADVVMDEVCRAVKTNKY